VGALTLCRLRAAHAALIERFVRRGWMKHLVEEAVTEADNLDRLDFADLCIDTDGLPVAEVARLVRERAGGVVGAHGRPCNPCGWAARRFGRLNRGR
jgi:hypothetical protein